MSDKPWTMEEQTLGKHLVLRNYLNGWFPILGSTESRLLFIDGFAGPGTYDDGEPGSPLVALDCIREHKAQGRLQGVEVTCLFIESDEAYMNLLETTLSEIPDVPDTSVTPKNGKFDETMAEILDSVDQQNKRLAPAFVMIDPFGAKGSPMELIGRVLQNPKSECLISFMYEPIRRFHQRPVFEQPLNELFGSQEWQRCFDLTEESERKQFLHDLFNEQLKKHGAKYVISCELWRGNRHIYTLYFATGHRKGCDLMKQSIWKVDPTGAFEIHGYAAGQRMLFGADTSSLKRQLKEHFQDEWVSIEQVEEFVMGDKTLYHTGHLRRDTLQPLEREKKLDVVRPSGVRGFPSGKGIRVRFK